MSDELPKLVPRPALSITGGTPSGIPDYRPINKLPKTEVEQLMKQVLKPVLYQVSVEERATGNSLRVGPKCSRETAHALASAINVQVGRGAELLWSNASVIAIL